MFTDAVTILDELVELHRKVIFPETLMRITWSMVASFECKIERRNDKLTLKHTTFWLSADRDPKSMMRLCFDDKQGEEFGKSISGDKLTAATDNPGNMSVILGYSPTSRQVDDVLKAHPTRRRSVIGYAPHDFMQSTPRGVRAANRRRRRR